MKFKKAKSQNLLAGKPEYFEPSKTNPMKTKLSGAGRQKKARTAKKQSTDKIVSALGLNAKLSEPEILEIAASRLAGIGRDNRVAAFEFATNIYFEGLTRMTGNMIPVGSFWDQFLALVEEVDAAMAKTFACNFQLQFLWCMKGHVHRLKMEHDQLPTSVQTFEIYQNGKEQVFVARFRDGSAVTLSEAGGYPRFDPCIIFAGMRERPPVSPSDFKKLEGMNGKDAVAQLSSGKFKFSFPDDQMFTADTALNVAKPADLARIRHQLSILALKLSPKK